MLGLHFNDVMADFYHRSMRLSVMYFIFLSLIDKAVMLLIGNSHCKIICGTKM